MNNFLSKITEKQGYDDKKKLKKKRSKDMVEIKLKIKEIDSKLKLT